MVYTNIFLILAVVLCVILLANRTKILKSRTQRHVDPLPCKPLSINEAEKLYADGELLCRSGYLHYQLDFANAIPKEELGVFVGYAKDDSKQKGRICVYDNQHVKRGYIDSQNELYYTLSVRKQAFVYGVLLHNEAHGYHGEVCIRVK